MRGSSKKAKPMSGQKKLPLIKIKLLSDNNKIKSIEEKYSMGKKNRDIFVEIPPVLLHDVFLLFLHYFFLLFFPNLIILVGFLFFLYFFVTNLL